MEGGYFGRVHCGLRPHHQACGVADGGHPAGARRHGKPAHPRLRSGVRPWLALLVGPGREFYHQACESRRCKLRLGSITLLLGGLLPLLIILSLHPRRDWLEPVAGRYTVADAPFTFFLDLLISLAYIEYTSSDRKVEYHYCIWWNTAHYRKGAKLQNQRAHSLSLFHALIFLAAMTSEYLSFQVFHARFVDGDTIVVRVHTGKL